jgi:hypothetical protein
VFPSEDVTDPPSAADFEFPFDVKHNRYFLQMEKISLRKGSAGARNQWKIHREQKQQAMEMSEGRMFSEADGNAAKY